MCPPCSIGSCTVARACGNDLSTPRPEYSFPGLRPGDRWCRCAAHWQEALEAGGAPPVVLAATHEAALEIVRREDLLRHAIDVAGGALCAFRPGTPRRRVTA